MKPETLLSGIKGIATYKQIEHILKTTTPIEVSKNRKMFKIKNSEGGVIIYFKKPQKMFSVFESYLMYSLVVLKKKPYDYAGYFKCPYGRDFVNNIEQIAILEKETIFTKKLVYQDIKKVISE